MKKPFLGCALIVWAAGAPAAAQAPPAFTAGGGVSMPAYVLPPSDYVSPAFRAATVAHLQQATTWPGSPALDAPKAEWDRYDALADDRIFGEATAWAKAQFPADVVETRMGGVRVAVVTPKSGVAPGNRDRVLLNVHGGGFIMGRGFVAALGEALPVAGLGRIKVVTVDYRMAPAHRFPAASEDVEAVYRELLKTYRAEAIGIFGCSAGGTLTAQAVARFQARGLPRPGAAGIFCAAPVPFGLKGDSAIWAGGRAVAVSAAARAAPPPQKPSGYMEGASPTDPLAYPGSSDAVLAKFPPTLLVSGTRANDMSAVVVAHARFLKLGVDSQLYVMEGGQHGAYNIGQHATPEAHDVVSYIVRWFDQHLAR